MTEPSQALTRQYLCMRTALVVVVLLVAVSCGAGEPAAQPSERRDTAAPAPLVVTPRPLASADRDCTVSWSQSFRSLDLLTDAADVIIRAQAVGEDIVQLRAFGARGPAHVRDARRTTLRVLETLKGVAEPEVRVIEDVCPGLALAPADEWVLFLGTPLDPKYGPDDPGVHRFTLGGPQGQFRIRASAISGPFFRFQHVVREYGGATAAELLSDVRAVRQLDLGLSRAIVARAGWTVLPGHQVLDLHLPGDASMPLPGHERPFGAFADASRRAGHDLAAFGGHTLRAVSYLLELDRPSTEKQYRATVLHDRGAVIGGWITVGHDLGDSEVFALTERDAAIASRGRR